MLPNAGNEPTGPAEPEVSVKVPTSIGAKFCCPPFLVCYWKRAVERAVMPEAAVYEYSDSSRWENNIGPSRQFWQGALVNSKSETSLVYGPTQEYFGFCVSATCREHSP